MGKLGIIASFSRTFCGSCNRIRVTPTGKMKTCLYGDDALDLKALLTDGSSDKEIKKAIVAAVQHKAQDGYIAEKLRNDHITESMATIGG